jgi:4-amino-4-deoxy-L-arabinose transferase-like glycosyltransferase
MLRFSSNFPRQIPKLVLVAVAVGLIVRMLGLLWILTHDGSSVLVYGDAVGYLELANNLSAGKGFVLEVGGVEGPEVFRTPGLPVLLLLFGGNITLYLVALSVAAAFTLPILLWWIGREIIGARTGVIAAWAVALEPLLIVFSWLPLTEIPFLIFALAGMALFIYSRKTYSWYFAVVSGLLFAAAVYIRPGNLLLIAVGIVTVCLYEVFKRHKKAAGIAVVAFIVLYSALMPWYIRTYSYTGTWALSGAGWRNVYTDYLASIRALKNNTMFWDEKALLKEEAEEKYGLSRHELNSPAYSDLLRTIALREIVSNIPTVIKLQTALFASYFTNDGYYSYASKLQFVPYIEGRTSATYALLTKGIRGVGDILYEAKRQLFIPVVGRLITVATTLLALVGAVRLRNKVAILLCLIIFLSALTSSVIGLGIEARLRLSIIPLLFLLAGAAFESRRTSP